MAHEPFLIYGVNGFTGRLIAERAKARGLRPIVAGRSRPAVEELGNRLGFETRVFDLEAPGAVLEGIRGARLVLHCAGPYSATSRPMVDACLQAGAHYLDITGELGVLEAVLARDAEARAAKVALLPAVGFDVIPTDCMAKTLQEELPDATRLELGFSAGTQPSPGTAKTAVEGLAIGALVRENGALVTLPRPRTRDIPFERGPRFAMSIPWGDLVTAHHSTRIPTITVYMEVPPGVARSASMLKYVAPILRMPSVVRFLKRTVEKRAKGPTETQRTTERMRIWGRVENAAGKAVDGHLDVSEGYELTVAGALAAAERVLGGEVPPGATTPSLAFGADFVTTLPGSSGFRLVHS
ncbi:MAG TPA: saccharopine dehydrogenase NADP-binding domain-containing protein [Polyangiaceae bacterium]